MCRVLSASLLSLAALLCALESPGQSPASDGGRFVRLDMEKAEPTKAFLSSEALSRLREALAHTFPGGEGKSLELKCAIFMIPTGKKLPFSVCTLSGGVVHVSLPQDWLSRPSDIDALVTAMLFAKAGLKPELADSSKCVPEWLVSAFFRKARLGNQGALPSGIINFPFTGVYAMSSNGMFPKLESILDSNLAGSSVTYSASIHAEYCHILLELCERYAGGRRELLAKIVQKTVESQGKKQSDIFAEVMSEALVKSEASSILELKKAKLEDWFKDSLANALLCGFMPASPCYIERLYRDSSKIIYKDVQGRECVCAITDLPSQWDSIPDRELAIASLLTRLALVASISEDGIKARVLEIQAAVTGIKLARTSDSIARLEKAERDFFSELERRIAIGAMLKRYEVESVPPSHRFSKTFSCLGSLESEEAHRRPELFRLLDKYDIAASGGMGGRE